MADLPSSDDVLERHQFYAALRAKQEALGDTLVRQHESIHRIHERMDEASSKITNVHEAINNTETRNKTIAYSFGIFWALIASTIGWAWDKSTTKVESYVTKIEQQEKEIVELRRDREKINVEIQAVAALRRQVTALQTEVEDLHKNDRKPK